MIAMQNKSVISGSYSFPFVGERYAGFENASFLGYLATFLKTFIVHVC